MGLATSELVEQLREEGYKVTTGYLQFLCRENPILKPQEKLGPLYVWQPADVTRLRAALADRGRGPIPEPRQNRSADALASAKH